jgi:hypothetical protein
MTITVKDEKRIPNRNYPAKRPSMTFLIVVLVVIAMTAVLLLFLTSIPEEGCQWRDQVKLDMTGMSDGWYNFSIVDTCLLDEDHPEIMSLQNVFLEIGSEGQRVEILDNDTMVKRIFLEKAKENGMNPLYWGTVSYFDTDGDDHVSEGDNLQIMSTSHGGPLEEGRTLELRDINSDSFILTYACC